MFALVGAKCFGGLTFLWIHCVTAMLTGLWFRFFSDKGLLSFVLWILCEYWVWLWFGLF